MWAILPASTSFGLGFLFIAVGGHPILGGIFVVLGGVYLIMGANPRR